MKFGLQYFFAERAPSDGTLDSVSFRYYGGNYSAISIHHSGPTL